MNKEIKQLIKLGLVLSVVGFLALALGGFLWGQEKVRSSFYFYISYANMDQSELANMNQPTLNTLPEVTPNPSFKRSDLDFEEGILYDALTSWNKLKTLEGKRVDEVFFLKPSVKNVEIQYLDEKNGFRRIITMNGEQTVTDSIWSPWQETTIYESNKTYFQAEIPSNDEDQKFIKLKQALLTLPPEEIMKYNSAFLMNGLLPDMYRTLGDTDRWEVTGEDNYIGRSVWVIEGRETVFAEAVVLGTRFELLLDKETGLALDYKLFDIDELQEHRYYENIKINETLDPAVFERDLTGYERLKVRPY